jgi:hypothetical protein
MTAWLALALTLAWIGMLGALGALSVWGIAHALFPRHRPVGRGRRYHEKPRR